MEVKLHQNRSDEIMESVKCSYCPTVFYLKEEDDANCPMCGSMPARTATKDDIKRARIAECLRDEVGNNITDETLRVLGIDPESLGKDE